MIIIGYMTKLVIDFLKIFWLKYKRNIPSVFCRVLFTAVSCAYFKEMKPKKKTNKKT